MSRSWNFNGYLKENGKRVVTDAAATITQIDSSEKPSAEVTTDEESGKLLFNLNIPKSGGGVSEDYLPLSGGSLSGSIITPASKTLGIYPSENSTGQIGSSDKKFYQIYGDNLVVGEGSDGNVKIERSYISINGYNNSEDNDGDYSCPKIRLGESEIYELDPSRLLIASSSQIKLESKYDVVLHNVYTNKSSCIAISTTEGITMESMVGIKFKDDITAEGNIILPASNSKGIYPASNNYGQIGSSSKKFYQIYATTFYGNLSGNATSATSATKATTATTATTAYGVTGSSACIEVKDTTNKNRLTLKKDGGVSIASKYDKTLLLHTNSNNYFQLGNGNIKAFGNEFYISTPNEFTGTDYFEGDSRYIVYITNLLDGNPLTDSSACTARRMYVSGNVIMKTEDTMSQIQIRSSNLPSSYQTKDDRYYEPYVYISSRSVIIKGSSDLYLMSSCTMVYPSYAGGTPVMVISNNQRNIRASFNVGAGGNKATGKYSFTQGRYVTASGSYSSAMGCNNTASGEYSHAEGMYTTASGHYAHAEGSYTTASSYQSHAEGFYTTASQQASHAEGSYTTASAWSSHAEGRYTTASGEFQHVQGKYNSSNTTSAHIVGGGTSSSNSKNIHTLDWSGNGWFAGDVTTDTHKLNSSLQLYAKAYDISTTAQTFTLGVGKTYLLMVYARNASTNAVYGMSARMIATPDSSSSTANVTILALGTTSNTGFTITAGNFQVSVKASSSTYEVDCVLYETSGD